MMRRQNATHPAAVNPGREHDDHDRHADLWPADRLDEARHVVANVAHHSDHLLAIACSIIIAHGETPEERSRARILLVVIEARRPLRLAGRQRDGLDGAHRGRSFARRRVAR